jgi:CobQ-like glutamine amidotransferase family enzyme
VTDSRLRIAAIYPELLGTYGDGGNVVVLERRLAWRGVEADVVEVRVGDPVPDQCDLYVIGGGEDTAQAQALDGLRRGGGLTAAVRRGAPVLAVCAGLQILGSTLCGADGARLAGLGLLDVDTGRLAHRAVGDVVATPNAALGLPVLLGFENHAGSTRLGPDARPLATVVTGVGNGGEGDGGQPRSEGALQGSVVATYLHGPVLARNPALADLLLARALGAPLAPLDLPHHEAAREQALARTS